MRNISKLHLFILLVLSPSLTWGLEQLHPKIVAVYPHDVTNFTQGLIIEGDILYESIGRFNQSKLKQTSLDSGVVLKEINLPSDSFAEGIAIVGDYLIQLTWNEEKALFYDRATLRYSHSKPYEGEGWGLCDDHGTLWMSNGSSELVQRDPKTFKILKKIRAMLNGRPVDHLNDLVCVGDNIYANVWKQDFIFRIDKNTGKVTGMIDARGLLKDDERKKLGHDDVLNGIAYRPDKKTFLLTGKCWPHLFEVVFH